MDNDPTYGQDLASKYADAATPLPSLGQTWQERETKLAKEIRTEGTLAGYLAGNPQLETKIIYLLSSGKTAEAKALWDRKNETESANYDGISAISTMDARNGTNARILVDQASRSMKREFDNTEVTLVDGRKTTVGRYFADPDAYKDPGESFRGMGFNQENVDAFLNAEDHGLRRAMGFFMKDAQELAKRGAGGTSVASMNIQNNEAASAIRTSWQDIRDTFGDGAEAFAQNVFATHEKSGAAAPMVGALLELGKAHAQATGLKGTALTDSLFGSYRDLVFSAYRGDSDRTGSTSRDVTPDKQMKADALIARTLAKVAQRDPNMYSMRLDDPALKAGLRDAVSMIAEASADMMDLVQIAQEGGHNIFDLLAEDMANRVKGVATDSIPARWRRFTDGLKNQFTGGRDFAQVAYDRSGDVFDYMKLSRSAGGESTNKSADGISAAIMANFRRTFAGDIFAGKTPYEAYASIASDPAKMRKAMDGMVTDLSKFFTGRGARPLAVQLAEQVFRTFGRGGRLNVEDALRDFANNEMARKASPLAYESARNWFFGTVAGAYRYDAKLAQLDTHLASDEGGKLNDRDRAAHMSRVRSRIGELTARAERGDTSVNPMLVIDEELNHGTYYTLRNAGPMLGKDGRPVIDPETRKPVPNLVPERRWTSNLRRDRTLAQQATGLDQSELRRRYDDSRSLQEFAAKRRLSEQIHQEYKEAGDVTSGQ